VSARIAPLLLVAIGVAVFANALRAPFVFDDEHAIVQNPHVQRIRPIWRAMSAPPQSALSGRPVVSLSLAVNAAAVGASPAALRAGNLAIHVAAALLLFGIVRRAATGWTAFVVALLWMIHPLQTEVVDYVTQRTESLMGLWYLATLYAAARGWTGAAVLACALGMASKESMITAPFVVLAYDVAFRTRSIGRALRERPMLYGGLAATWIVLAVLNLPGPRSQTAGWSTPVTPWMYLLNQAPMIATYLKLAVWPAPLIVDYGPVRPVTVGAVAAPALLILALLAVAVWSWTRSRPLALLGTWFFVTLAPASSIVPIATEVGAERRMYLPLVAVAALAVFAARSLTAKRPAWRPVLAVAAVLACAAVTVQRNAEFGDPVELWRGVVAHRPHARARHALGFALQLAGRREDAMVQYRLAAPDYSLAHFNMGLQLEADGRLDEAAAEFRERLRREPSDTDARGRLADVLLRQGRFEAAAAEYAEFIRRAPGSAAAHNNLGLALVQQDRIDDAIREFRVAVSLAPEDRGARQNLQRALSLLAFPRSSSHMR
jgi:tetratricopeptide (TPR) repeat protein